MSDTPRTDAAVIHATFPDADVVTAVFARQLERENAALREALTSDRLVKEIAMQVRHYEPISEENVRELLDDIRQGIAIYLDEAGLAESVSSQDSPQPKPGRCADMCPDPFGGGTLYCDLRAGHAGMHETNGASWTNPQSMEGNSNG